MMPLIPAALERFQALEEFRRLQFVKDREEYCQAESSGHDQDSRTASRMARQRRKGVLTKRREQVAALQRKAAARQMPLPMAVQTAVYRKAQAAQARARRRQVMARRRDDNRAHPVS
eukprot:scaffold347216_cov35-Prasinocladus_malaysianus.AAC.1